MSSKKKETPVDLTPAPLPAAGTPAPQAPRMKPGRITEEEATILQAHFNTAIQNGQTPEQALEYTSQMGQRHLHTIAGSSFCPWAAGIVEAPAKSTSHSGGVKKPAAPKKAVHPEVQMILDQTGLFSETLKCMEALALALGDFRVCYEKSNVPVVRAYAEQHAGMLFAMEPWIPRYQVAQPPTL